MSDVLEVTSKKTPLSGEGRGEGSGFVGLSVIGLLLRTETTHKNSLLNVHFPKY